MNRARIALTAFGLALATTAAAPAPGDAPSQIKLSDCPEAVRATIEGEAAGGKIETVRKEIEDGETTYLATAEIHGRTFGIEVDEDGTLTELGLEVGDDEIKLSDCPEPVRKTLREEAKDAKLGPVTRDVRYGETIYETVAVLGKKDYEIVIAEDGTLVEKTLIIEDDEIELSNCPAAVQKTFREIAKGGPIDEVAQSSGLGRMIYEAKIAIKDKAYIVELTKDGALIAKSLVDEDD